MLNKEDFTMKNKLKPWDGVCGYFQYKMPDQLLVDENGTVYYIGADGEPWVWCAAAELRHHLNRLFQITNMVEIIKN